MKITWIGQSGYILNDGKTEICIDPYLSDIVNKVAGRERMVECPVKPRDLKSDVIICTHNHLDHLDIDAISEMNLSNKVLYAPSDCMEQLDKLGVKNKVAFNEGDKVTLGNFELEAVFADHTVPAIGVIVRCGGKTLYFSGDTYYNGKLEKLENYNIDCMFICINGQLGNMNVDEAVKLTKVINPKVGIPNHYGMFANNTEDPTLYTSRVKNSFEMKFNYTYSIIKGLGGRMFDLTGKTALVTGSSQGIGKAIAKCLADYGAKVFVHGSTSYEKCEKAVDEIGSNAKIAVADLSVDGCADKLYKQTGDVDILVLNASLQCRTPWNEISSEEFDKQIRINLKSTLELIQKYASRMQNQKWGRIVTVGSVQQYKPHKDMAIYAASKCAQMSLVTNFAKQLGADGITMNNMSPGVIATPRNEKALSDCEYRKLILSGIPLGFEGTAEDCTGVVLLLCSNAGRYITGTDIIVDGGMHL